MPLAMSSANLTAWLWSTTRAEEGRNPRVRSENVESCRCFRLNGLDQLLTSALVQDVEKRSVGHVMGDDDGVRGWRCLTGPEDR